MERSSLARAAFAKVWIRPAEQECEGPLADGGKVIVVSTETDVEWNGYIERGENADYRVVEIAGVSHIPASAADFRGHGLPEQNPVELGPVVRAALVNLQAWLRGTEPPPSITIQLTEDAAKELQGSPYRTAARDADGNAIGGVRLPHMPAMLVDGRKSGAPLGRYNGLAREHENDNVFFLISGSFTPFPPENLARSTQTMRPTSARLPPPRRISWPSVTSSPRTRRPISTPPSDPTSGGLDILAAACLGWADGEVLISDVVSAACMVGATTRYLIVRATTRTVPNHTLS